jgi:hypothetical protein
MPAACDVDVEKATAPAVNLRSRIACAQVFDSRSMSTIAGGVFSGATAARQFVALKPGGVSATVGRSGRNGARGRPVVASGQQGPAGAVT